MKIAFRPEKSFVFIALLSVLVFACKKDDENNIGEVIEENSEFMPGKGIFIINEGIFQSGNGSVDFINQEKQKLYKNIFYTVNKIALGDVPTSMKIYSNRAFIVVNNSGKIEVVDLNDFRQITTISGFNQPRKMIKVSDDKAYVSSLAEPSLYIVDLNALSVVGNVDTQKSCENLLKYNDHVYTTNWSNWYVPEDNNSVQLIDINSDQKVNEIIVTKEPNSMVIDKNDIVWVLCSGGFMGDELPALCKIDPASQLLIQRIHFPDTNMNPAKLCINGSGDKLYFLNNGIYAMDINETAIPATPLIGQSTNFFYALFVDPETNKIYASDAKDFTSNGAILIYDKEGNYEGSRIGGINPGSFTYNP